MELKNYKDYIDIQLTKRVKDANISKWLPFIGKDYQKAPEKVLIVGLSHYEGTNEKWHKSLNTPFPNLDCNCQLLGLWKKEPFAINGVLADDNKLNQGLECYFFDIRKKDLKKRDILNKRLRLWNSIAFTQFTETPVKEGTKHKKENKVEMTRRLKRLVELIKIIKPNHIIMMSNWWNYHSNLEEMLNISDAEKTRKYKNVTKKSSIRVSFLNVDGLNFALYSLYHPSYFKYINLHHSLLKENMPDYLTYLNGKE